MLQLQEDMFGNIYFHPTYGLTLITGLVWQLMPHEVSEYDLYIT